MTDKRPTLTEKEKLALLKEKRKASRVSDRTNRIMELGFIIKELEEALEAYKKALVTNTATKKQVGKLYFLMNKLGSKNRRAKGLFKDK